jgi:hypothetical protein
LDWLGTQLGVKSREDWYKVKPKDAVQKDHGSMINNYYGGSLIKALQTIYTDTPWKLHLFDNVPKSLWLDTKNHRVFVDQIAQHLNIKEYSDWYDISTDTIR